MVAAVALFFAGAADTARAQSQERVLELDPAHTQISFTLDATFHTVHGTFQLKRGSVRFNSDGGVASGVVVIDARSGKTGNDSRDAKMNAEILQSDKYPEIIFVPESVTGRIDLRDPFQVDVHGVIKMHGTEHPITITTRLVPKGNQLLSDSRFAIPYVAWGLKNPSSMLLRVGDKISVEMHTEGKYAPVGSMASAAGSDRRTPRGTATRSRAWASSGQPLESTKRRGLCAQLGPTPRMETALAAFWRTMEQFLFGRARQESGGAARFTSALGVDCCLRIHSEVRGMT
jgi:polyisoprenoid-binding protein YceI